MPVIASIISRFDEKGVKQAESAHDTLGGKLGNFGKVAGAALAGVAVAAGAMAVKLGVDAVKAAQEDEAAAAKLAKSLQNVTGATGAQVAAVEAYITKTTLATGVTDDQLRPSLDRLVRSTKDVAEAQQLQALALDIAAGTGKSLESVTNALAKAHDGQSTALGKLGVGIDAATLKSMSFDDITKTLGSTFAGQAATAADTYQGKMGRLNAAFTEAKETVGGYILDALTPLLDVGVNKLIPMVGSFADKLGKDLGPAIAGIFGFVKTNLLPVLQGLWSFIANTLIPGIVSGWKPVLEGVASVFQTVANKVQANRDKLEPFFSLMGDIASFAAKTLAPVIGTILGGALKTLGTILGGIIDAFATLVGWITGAVDGIKGLAKAIGDSPIAGAIGNALGGLFGGGRAAGGPVSSGTTYLVGERGPELFTPNRGGSIIPNGAGSITINVSGALDPVAVASQIQRLLQGQNVRMGLA